MDKHHAHDQIVPGGVEHFDTGHPQRQGDGSSGVAGKLVAGVITHARSEGVEILLLAVNAANLRAIRLYELAGFVQYGLEPRALKQPDGTYSDDELYWLPLDG